ncbi:hypothetical protein [Burkholderia contaminans]|uniref:hypothetical protein n=1 Tax=Burkholderia contaminans TaxID=488447 RepID=UPI00158A47C4|nr:hypothetical protein [Burkholderia contaminans]
MKITKAGLNMSAYVVDLTCLLCLTEFEASADPKVGEAHVYDGGDIPAPGESRQLRAICTCPNCGVQANQAVRLRLQS